MSSNTGLSKSIAIIVTTTVVASATAAAVYFITIRKKKIKSIIQESFISNRNLSWFSLAGLKPSTVGTEDNQHHPEGPNIGFNSDSSWFGYKFSGKADTIHSR
jgi:hypothetical protein